DARDRTLIEHAPACPRCRCAFCKANRRDMLMKNHRPGQAKQAEPQAEEQPKAADQAKAADQPQPEEQPKKVNQSERHLQSRFETFPHALKHGAFSALSILPGEDEKEFMELHQSIAAELLPDGPIENGAVQAIAL